MNRVEVREIPTLWTDLDEGQQALAAQFQNALRALCEDPQPKSFEETNGLSTGSRPGVNSGYDIDPSQGLKPHQG